MIKLGLVSRIAILVVLVQIIAFSLLGAFYVNRFSNSIEERTYTHLKLVGKMIANDELAVSTISNKSVMSDLIGAPYRYGMVIGGNGRVVVSTNPAHLGQLASQISSVEAKWTDTSAEKFIRDEGTLTAVMHSPIYTTIITIGTEEIDSTKEKISNTGLIGSLLFIILSSAGIVLIARRFISQRVDVTLLAMKKIEQGALEVRVPITSNDGLGQLQKGINSMTATISELVDQHRRSAEEIQTQSQRFDSIIENIPNMLLPVSRQNFFFRYIKHSI